MAEFNSRHHFETIIIGGGLAGLLVAARLAEAGQRFLLLEEKEELGGYCRPQVHALGTFGFGFKSLPAHEAGHRAADFLESQLGFSLQRQESDLPPITFEGGKFKPFLGFGSEPPPDIDELEYYLFPRRLVLRFAPHTWIAHLREKIPAEQIVMRSVVTRILIEQGTSQGVMVNGAQTYTAERLIYTGSKKALAQLLPSGALPTRLGQKLAKSPFWTAVGLDLVHAQTVSESRALHVLRGGKEDASPCLGYFYEPGAELNLDATSRHAAQISRWMTLVSAEGSEDPEITGASVRKIKKQIKRAYPEALDHLLHERIYVANLSHGSCEIKLTAGVEVPGIAGLYLSGSGIGSGRNLIGVCEQTQSLLNALGLDAAPAVFAQDAGESAQPPLSLDC